MKKTDLKALVRNRILEQKAKMAEAEDSFVNTRDSDFNNKLTIIKNQGFNKKIQAFKDVIEDYLEIFNLSGKVVQPHILDTLVQFDKNQITKAKDSEEDTEEDTEEKELDMAAEAKEEVEEMSTSGGAGAYQTKYAFKLPKDYKKVSEGVIEPKEKKKA